MTSTGPGVPRMVWRRLRNARRSGGEPPIGDLIGRSDQQLVDDRALEVLDLQDERRPIDAPNGGSVPRPRLGPTTQRREAYRLQYPCRIFDLSPIISATHGKGSRTPAKSFAVGRSEGLFGGVEPVGEGGVA